jgi:signal transduction histidine kinase/DNA-binding response OmpR family regulator
MLRGIRTDFFRAGLKYLLYLLCALPLLAQAQAIEHVVYEIDTGRQVHNLATHTAILVDSSARITPRQLAGGQFDKQFQLFSPYQKPYVRQWNYWLRIPVKASAPLQNWRFLIKKKSGRYYAQWDHFDVYVTDAGGRILSTQAGGLLTPRSKKSVKDAAGLNAVNLTLPTNETRIIFVRLRNDFSDGTGFLPELRNPAVGLPHDSGQQMLYMLSAIAGILCLLSFCFLIVAREKAYLFFSIYLLFLALHYLILDPSVVFINYFIPEHPELISYCFHLLASGGLLFFLLFGRYFINLPVLSPRTDRFIQMLLILWSGIIVTELILMAIFHHSVLSPWAFVVLLACTIGLLIRIAFFNSIPARFYVIGALWLASLSVLGFLYDVGRLNIGFNPWPVAQVGQMVIYMIGLAYKIRLNETARAEAERIRETDALKSRFFANISHEFRTPLTLIQGPLKQIEEGISQDGNPLAEVPTRHLTMMRRNTDRLLELVNQLLDLSKLDSRAMRLRVVRGDVIQSVKMIVGSFESLAERNRLHYHVHYPETTVFGYFDRDKLEKIVTNLLGNAFKYTPEGETIVVRAEIDEKRFRFSVEDSGPGIAKKELKQIFDRFYQVESADNKGSGIGLALVKELMDLYRGQISISSEPGKGSRFKISLPIDRESFRPEEIVPDGLAGENRVSQIDNGTDAEENLKPAATPDLNLPLALVVEDNDDLRQFIGECIGGQYRVLEADTGTAGWKSALMAIPDVIISDVMMPGFDGFELAEKLKKDERTSHIPVILLTAKAGLQHKIEGLKTGADDYLTKPFDAPELLTRMANLITQRRLLRKKFAGQIILKPSEVTVESADDRFLQKVMQAIEQNLGEEEFSVEKLAEAVAMSRSQLHRKLQALLDKSPSDLLRQTRLFRAQELLQKKAGTPSEIGYLVGFSSHTYFSKAFKDEFGISPSEV